MRYSLQTWHLSLASRSRRCRCARSHENEPPTVRPLDASCIADGNYKEAYDGLRRFVLTRTRRPPNLPQALETAIACLQQLNRVDEIDEFREQAVAAHRDDWRLLAAVAQSYLDVEHHGYMIAGEFHRGQHRGGGKFVNATARDRVRALQLFLRAMKAAESADDKRRTGRAAQAVRRRRSVRRRRRQAWRLQSLTDLETLPDYEEGWGYTAASRKVRRSTQMATRSSTTSPRAGTPPKTTASAGAGCSKRWSSGTRRGETKNG